MKKSEVEEVEEEGRSTETVQEIGDEVNNNNKNRVSKPWSKK